MSFLTSEALLEKLKDTNIVYPFDTGRVKSGAYELSMGDELFVTASPTGVRQHFKQKLGKGEEFLIPTGQFALLLTKESVCIPDDMMAFISIKAGAKFKGLINISGFHVDPGYTGKLMFAVHNVGPSSVRLKEGQPLFPIWFAALVNKTSDVYDGKSKARAEITSQDIDNLNGEFLSITELGIRIDRLEGKLKYAWGFILLIVAALFGALFAATLNQPQGVNDSLRKEKIMSAQGVSSGTNGQQENVKVVPTSNDTLPPTGR